MLHLAQLSGNASLLGADVITWRLTGAGLSVVGGGNGSGKSLLCASIYAATFPKQTEALRSGLFAAGLRTVTLVGLLDSTRKEWSLDLESGAIIHRPELTNDLEPQSTPITELVIVNENIPAMVPHFIMNGDWQLPCAANLEWAGAMLAVPLERELASWERRLDSLEHGEVTTNPDALQAEIANIDAQLARAQALRETAALAEQKAAELQGKITDAELAIQIASAEETELVGKIELAERAVHLESWAEELRSSWNSVEATRAQFAQLYDRLEMLQEMTRNLPNNVQELAQEYLRLQRERESTSVRLQENEGKVAQLEEQRNAIAKEKELLQTSLGSESAVKLEKLHRKVAELERESTELSRKRIDLLRRRDGLEQQRNEKYRELTLLGPEEWTALELFLSSNDHMQSSTQQVETEKQRAELGRIADRLRNEFSGFEKLASDTPARVEKLFGLRESISKREADLVLLRSKVVEMQTRGTGAGLKSVLAIVGAAAAGVPCGLLLGWDIGFFAGVLGGGAGFGIGHMMVPKSDVSHEELVRKIETMQHEQQESLAVREALRLELSVLSDQQKLDGALARWQEFVRISDRQRVLDTAIAATPVVPKMDESVPAVLRKLEREDIRRRVNEYRALTVELTDATVELSAFDHPDGPSARKLSADNEALLLREEIGTLELESSKAQVERERLLHQLSIDLARVENELVSLVDVTLERSALRDILVGMESIDEAVAHAFSQSGPESILQALYERNDLQNELRETKAKLSTEHSPQELSVRTNMIEVELRQVTEHLQEYDPLFGTLGTRLDGLNKYRGQMEKLFNQSSENEKLINQYTHEIHSLRLPELKREIDELPAEQALFHDRAQTQHRLDELTRSIHAAHEMCAALTGELAELREQAISRVLGILQSKVFDAIGERYASIEWANGVWYVIADDGQKRLLSTLSRGIAELVTLCLYAGLLSASSDAERVPVVWDDVLSQLDDYHLSIARNVIEQIARDRQIVLLTRDPRIRTWGKSVEVLVGQYQLDALIN
ncbi:MAG: hypothetical protein IPP40_05810 [bacterium]|nr:hypothetical protein [bacterium]